MSRFGQEKKREDVSNRFTTLPMCDKRVASLCLLCCEATGVASGVDSGYGSGTADSVEEAQAELKSISSLEDNAATVGQQITSTPYEP